MTLPDPVDEAIAAAAAVVAEGRAVIAGPWHSEVGFELLYWIPFLRWLVHRHEGLADRLFAVSRGGAAPWYADVGAGYVDVLELMEPADFVREKRAAIAERGGKQKQVELSPFDQLLLGRAAARLGLDRPAILHPALVYRLYKRLWKQDAVGRFASVARYELLPPPRGDLAGLPDEYVAVRFYFSLALPRTPESLGAISALVDGLAAQTAVVLLDSPFAADDHEDARIDHESVIRLDHLMQPADNLTVQTAAIAGASVFFGTYGGLAYLPPQLGVPALSFYSRPGAFHRTHLELAQRVFDGRRLERLLAADLALLPALGLLSGVAAATASSGVQRGGSQGSPTGPLLESRRVGAAGVAHAGQSPAPPETSGTAP